MGDNLRLRRLVFVDWCIMCHHCGEMIDHLLLHREMAYWLWSFVFKSFGLSWVIPRSILDLLFGWWNWLGKHVSDLELSPFVHPMVYLEGTESKDF